VIIRQLLLYLALALLPVTLAGTTAAQTEILDQVVAIVDDDVVMASELRERLERIRENIRARGMEMPPEDELVRQTLDQLILESIQLQMGQRVGVRISDSQLTGAMQRIAAQNGLTLEEFRQRLEAKGQSYAAMREDIRQEMIIQRVQSGNVNQRIEISEEEVDNFLATEEGQELVQPQYRLAHALLPVSGTASKAEEQAAREHVEKLLDRIRAGEPFDEVIASSGGDYTFSGGDLGWRRQSGLPSLFQDIAPTMEEDEVSDPIRSESGFHLIKLVDKQGGELMVEQTRVRHILVEPSEIRTEEETRELMRELRQRARGDADFAELAREYSEDIG